MTPSAESRWLQYGAQSLVRLRQPEPVSLDVYSRISFFFPSFPFVPYRFEHGSTGPVQPLSFLLLEVSDDRLDGRSRSQMDIGNFPAHCTEELDFGPGGLYLRELDSGAMGTEPAYDPAPAQLQEWIRTAHGPANNLLVKDLG